jgi:hypothetical protein
MIKLFTDDTKVFATVNYEEDKNSFQGDIDKLMNWSDTCTWLLKFNKSKCKHMHLGPETDYNYMMEENMIAYTMEEKDLGIIIDKLNSQNPINKQVNKANQKLGLINRSFKYMDKDMFLQLLKSLVRLHLEYGSTVWSVANKREAIIIENVQRRSTRLIKEIQHLSYGNTLKHLRLSTLQYRRIRADVIETFKIIKGMDKVEIDTIFPKNNTSTARGLISLRLGFRRNFLSVLHPNLVSSPIKGILKIFNLTTRCIPMDILAWTDCVRSSAGKIS